MTVHYIMLRTVPPLSLRIRSAHRGIFKFHSRPQSCDPFGQRHGSRALAGSENRKSANGDENVQVS